MASFSLRSNRSETSRRNRDWESMVMLGSAASNGRLADLKCSGRLREQLLRLFSSIVICLLPWCFGPRTLLGSKVPSSLLQNSLLPNDFNPVNHPIQVSETTYSGLG